MKNENKTFIILTPGFAASESDTVCLPMQQQFVKTIKLLYPQLEIIIISFQYPYFKDSYQWFGNTVKTYDGRNAGGVQRLLLRKKIYRDLKKIQEEREIIGLLSFWLGECALVGKRFGEKHSIRHYCWISGQDARKANKYPQRVAPKPGELIALSDFLRDEFERNHGIRPAWVIPPGFDTKLMDAAEINKDIEILSVGSLIPLKQFEVFVEAVAEIKKSLPLVKARLVGEGPERKKISDLVAQYELGPNIQLTGELTYGEVLSLMQRSKVLLHPSSYEGFSGVCMEALAMGAHVISFCKPMEQNFEQWHVAGSKEEMKVIAIQLLLDQKTSYRQYVFYTMEDTVRKMMGLYS